MILRLTIIFTLLAQICYAQCVDVTFQISPTNVCIDENIAIFDVETAGNPYFFDYCGDDLIQTPIVEQLFRDLRWNGVSGLKIINSGSLWYGFVASTSNNKLFRVDFGADLENTLPDVIDLGNVDGNFNGPESVDFILEDGVWYALVSNTLEESVVRLNFGGDLANVPTSDLIAIPPAIGLSFASTINIVEDGDDVYCFLVNRGSNDIVRMTFGTSITSSPTIENLGLSGLSSPIGSDLVQDCSGSWYLFTYSTSTNILHRIEMATLSSLASIADLTTSGDPLSQGLNSKLQLDNGNFYLIVSSKTGNFLRVEIGASITNNSVNVTDLGNFGILPNTRAFDIVEIEGYFLSYSIGNDVYLYKQVYENDCATDTQFSDNTFIHPINYNQSGTYGVELKVIYSPNRSKSTTSSVMVSTDQAALLSITMGANACVTEPIDFSSTADQTISTYLWDFGDGSGTSTDPNPSYTYASTGTYNVRLTVESGENGCGQFIEQEVTVYNEPISDITVPAGTLCSNTPINFTNSSTFDIGSPVSWEWDFGDTNTSSEFEPEHTYLVGGNYTVTLTATLPEGCVSVDTQNIFVEQGALPNFSFNNSCQGEIIQFNDLSSSPSSITNWDWDFGDGSSASIQNPAYSYTSVGTFDVTLSVTNQLGCVTSITQQVSNFANPIVDFENDLSCSGSFTNFTDQSIVQDANISTWFWDFGTGNAEDRDTLQNPQFEYQEPGEYDVTLTVRSNFGCETTLVKPVTVNPGPIASFDWDESCLGSETQFINNTTTDPSNPLVSTVWTIEGNIIESTAPAYNFDEVGSYPVVLSVVAENFCESTQIDTVHVTNNPIANFNSQQFCDSDTILFYDTTIIPPGDSVNARLWDFGIFGTSTDSVAKVYWPDTESRVVKFQIGTDNGCLSSVNQSVSREIQPVASFEPSVNFGAAPLTVSFANFSENASGYSWEFGNGEVSDDENPSVQYLDEGIYTVLLNATTASGCADTVSQTIEVVAPEMEMELVSLLSRAVGDQVEVILNMANNGSIVVDESNLEIVSKIGTGFELTQDFDDVIAPNTSQNYSLNFRLNDNGLNRNQSICVELRTTDPDNPDIVPENNEQCIFVKPEPIFSDPFPNPAQDEVVVEVVLPEPDNITINLVNSQGQSVYNQVVSETQAGINSISLDLQTFRAGNYVLLVFYQGWERSYNVVLVK